MSDFKAGEFEDNGLDYEILEHYAGEIKDLHGLTCEIGLRAGGGTKRILNGIKDSSINRTHIAIDPYGALPYKYKQNITTEWNDYSNDMKHKIMISIANFCIENPHINFNLYPMEDYEFMRKFANGVPVYENEKKQIVKDYALVYLDGPHTVESTLLETFFFEPRIVKGGYLICDDVVGFYDHSVVRDYLMTQGWTCVASTAYKAVYKK